MQYLTADASGCDQLLAEPLADGALAFEVAAGRFGDLLLIVVSECLGDVAETLDIFRVDREVVAFHFVPELAADHLELYRFHVSADLFPERAVGLLDLDRGEIIEQLIGGGEGTATFSGRFDHGIARGFAAE